ncbi:MAG: lipoyl(octanoyl) transferase LipB [Thermodesulfobacteriota bacterium]
MNTLNVYKIGLVAYKDALDLQMRLIEKRKNGEIGDTLLLLEHPPTFTIGRKGDKGHLLINEKYLSERGIHFEEISRGGDITFHGPGQVVGYPILDLNSKGRDLHKYLRGLEEFIVSVLAGYEIEANRIEGLTGVWVDGHKIASIGVGVKRWITYHGFALNVNTDLSYFDMIVPCGIPDVKMTSVSGWLGRDEVAVEDIEESIIKEFIKTFNFDNARVLTTFDSTTENLLENDLLFNLDAESEKDKDLLI